MGGKRVPHKRELDRLYGDGWEHDEYLVIPVCVEDEALQAPVAPEPQGQAPAGNSVGAFSLRPNPQPCDGCGYWSPNPACTSCSPSSWVSVGDVIRGQPVLTAFDRVNPGMPPALELRL